jgi:hypothetical protein
VQEGLDILFQLIVETFAGKDDWGKRHPVFNWPLEVLANVTAIADPINHSRQTLKKDKN